MKTTKTSPHILNTSANLLGFCLFVITALHVNDKHEGTIMDEFTSVIALLLALSSLLSFFSIRTENATRLSGRLEDIADALFIISLVAIVLLILFIFLYFL
ncbi:hypothetical protein M8998_07925 [Sphingobacterium sp. lm-10]|uniref:hypothetical protein n=1 Tax=Sphingobacterium sp. lm-10 TaxID=2944904 RepID=UPI0020203B4D|nr:hypothetical protein [Sphingobacterium sp. lm-10]MCL7987863.1 hypothetical protein [Sphingobacterium sp. lm-10]